MNNFFKISLDFLVKTKYITLMNNNLMDMVQVGCEESISAADEAQMEHERGSHEREEFERGAGAVAIHGPLMTDVEWRQYLAEYGEYMDMVWKD